MADSKEAYSALNNEPTGPPPYAGPAESYAPPAQQPYPQMQQPQYAAYGMQPQPVMTQPMVNTTSTTVVIGNQQAMYQGPRDWHDGLCACFNDCGSCFMGLCCPLCLLCDVSTQMGEGCCIACLCPLTTIFGLRVKLRAQNNIQGSLCDDYCSVYWCNVCVLCQLSRELKFTPRGQF